jgi:hypothetical protein
MPPAKWSKMFVATKPLGTREQPVMRASPTHPNLRRSSVALKNLDAYLNDHLAGSVAALELIEHWRDQHKDEPIGNFFRHLETEIRADQDKLCEAMQSLGIDESGVRQTGAWAAEKVAQLRMKIAGDQPGLVLALEGLIMGITGKKMLWRSLAAANLLDTSRWDFEELQRRAEQQIEQAEVERIGAARRAFADTSDWD